MSLFVGWKLMKMGAPVPLGAIGCTGTYAISNVLLPLMGPVVVGVVWSLK